jgi:hypothetical protein
MPFAEAPSLEYQIVLCDLRQCDIKGAPGRRRQNYILERSARHNGLDRAAPGRAKQTRKWDRRHPLHGTAFPG